MRSQLRGQRAKLVVKIISLKSTHCRPYSSAMPRVSHVVMGSTLSDLTDNYSPGMGSGVYLIICTIYQFICCGNKNVLACLPVKPRTNVVVNVEKAAVLEG